MTIKSLFPAKRASAVYNVISGRVEPPANISNVQPQETYCFGPDLSYVKFDPNSVKFNYDHATGELQGLVVDAEYRNFIINSNVFDVGGESTAEVNTTETLAIDGSQTATKVYGTSAPAYYNEGVNKTNTVSFFIKKASGEDAANYFYVAIAGVGGNNSNLGLASRHHAIVNLNDGSFHKVQYGYGDPSDLALNSARITKVADNWWYYEISYRTNGSYNGSKVSIAAVEDSVINVTGADLFEFDNIPISTELCYYVCFAQCHNNYRPTGTRADWQWRPYQMVGETVTTRPADILEATANSRTLNNGFSLLLDSETTTYDFIYKIKKDDDVVASLSNDSGTLDWEINGKSAETNGEYPQVGFQFGRVRTISAFGQAGGGDTANYLYTTGLSFPTMAEPAEDANKIQFGTPQNIKAIYLWEGQLNGTNAISIIKGKYNEVPLQPIDANTFSFVYDTDPKSEGNLTITLPYITPTVSMRVDWGDGNSNAYEKGIVPSHTYPYPGRYRIQIEADDGFDSVRLGDERSTITIVDQWAPEYRTTASGPGFTGDSLSSLLKSQKSCTSIPDFKYDSSITDLGNTFYDCANLAPNNWSFIPTNLPNCTSLANAFGRAFYAESTVAERASFPTLQTSSKLTTVNGAWSSTRISAFVNNSPLSNSSNVTNWNNAFYDCRLTNITLDLSAATSMSNTFYGNSFVTSPIINAPNCTNYTSIFQDCEVMTEMNPNIINSSFGNGTTFTNAWNGCTELARFPQIDTSSATKVAYAWYGTTNLSIFPALNFSSVTDNFYRTWASSGITAFPQNTVFPTENFSFDGSFYGAPNLKTMPDLPSSVTQRIRSIGAAWRGSGLTSFPEWDLSNCVAWTQAWYGCQIDDDGMPKTLDTRQGTSFAYTWLSNTFTTFPYNGWSPDDGSYNFANATSFYMAWWGCASLTDFAANMFDNTGTLVESAFADAWGRSCKLNAQSIENIILSCVENGSTNVRLDLSSDPVFGGSNAKYDEWSDAAKAGVVTLESRGWTVVYSE